MIAIPGVSFGKVDFSQFEDDLEESLGVPYIRNVNPQERTVKKIEANPSGYGLIIPEEQAEAAEFSPDANWELKTLTQITKKDEVEIKGYYTKTPSFVVVARSQLEAQEKSDNGWRYIGLAYDKGNLTPFGRMVEEDKGNEERSYRNAVRYLLMFVGQDGTFLHKTPIAFTGHGGMGGAFGKEVSSYFDEVNQAYCRATKSRGRLSQFAQAFILHSMELSFFKGEGKNPYTCIGSRLGITLDEKKVGSNEEFDRPSGKVSSTLVALGSVMIPKESELGQEIKQLTTDYADFGKPNRGQSDASETVEMFCETGILQDHKFETNGKCRSILVYGDSQQAILAPESLQGYLDTMGDYTVKGIKQAGVVIAESIELVSGPAVVGADAEQGSLTDIGY